MCCYIHTARIGLGGEGDAKCDIQCIGYVSAETINTLLES